MYGYIYITTNLINNRKYMKSFKQLRATLLEAEAASEIKLDKKIRERGNKELKAAGFDGNGRFPSVSKALSGIASAIKKAGLDFSDLISADLFLGKQGHRAFDITQQQNSLNIPVSNSQLAIDWTELEPGKFEIVAYLS